MKLEFDAVRSSLLFQVFKNPRFANVVLVKDDLQGDGEWTLVLTLFWISLKFELLVADYYCHNRPRYDKTFEFNLMEWLGFKPIPPIGIGSN